MYLRDPTLRQQHGANARHRALCEFDPRIMREALLQEYVRLLGERGCDELGGHLDWGRRPHAGGIRGDRWLNDYEITNEQDLSRNNPARQTLP